MKSKEKLKHKFNFWPYFGKHKGIIAVYLFLLLLDVGIQTFYSIYAAGILVAVAEGAHYVAINKFLVMLVVIIFSNICGLIRNTIYYHTSQKIVNEMRVDIAYQSFKISDKAYTNHNTSNFTQRIASDPMKIFDGIHNIVMNVQGIITALIMVGYITIISPVVGVIAMLTVGSIIVVDNIRKKKNKKNRKEMFKRDEKTSSLLNEVVRSQKDIKSLNLETELKKDIKNLSDYGSKQTIKTHVTNRNLMFVRSVILNIMITALMVVALIFREYEWLTLTSFMIIYNNRYEINWLSSTLGTLFDFYTDIDLAVTRISELYEDDEYPLETFGKKNLKNIKGEIEFEQVGFSYLEYRNKTDEEIKKEKEYNKLHKIKTRVKTREIIGKKKVFEDLSFKIEPNTSVAFVGKSGSGKTTILNLLSKMYDADNGKVLIDGWDIQKLSKETLRAGISLVNQFPYIFDRTIKENLIMAKPNATQEEIDLAVKESALDEFVETLPQGLDTIVGESGIKLSGGQKQRVAIARAMLRKSSIIVFDESTSSLDNIAQAQIKKSIDGIKGKSTVVIVAHRLSTIKNVDKIFFLEEGKIVDIGTFEELYKRNKEFKRIFLAENV